MFLEPILRRPLFGILLSFAIFGCEPGAPQGGGDNHDAGSSPPPGDAGSAAVDYRSRAPALKRKDGEQLSRDLAQALEIGRNEVCLELGQYDCAEEAHKISLGGVEPYRLRIDEPLPGVGVAGPIAVERVALSACGLRARKDFEGPEPPVVFGPLGSAGGSRAAVVDDLYERLLGRAPDPEERAMLSEWTAPGMTDRDFAVLACFVVATSLEHLFY